MGLRSFVALPVDRGGTVFRFQLERNQDTDINRAIVNSAYGLSAYQTLLFGIPYRLSPSGADQLGDLNVLYRHNLSQQDFFGGTRRHSALAGVVIPSDSDRDAAIQAGWVSTFYSGRNEWDVDALVQAGINNRPDRGRYDISWQHRLAPSRYPEWGLGTEWNSVIELGGRWTQGSETLHQVTLGLQWIQSRWVIEGGVFQDVNGSKQKQYLLSGRFHF